jgi:hypothetical protein
MIIIRNRPELLSVIDIKFLYHVTPQTLVIADNRRKCWYCSEKFNVGDGMSAAMAQDGVRLLHSRCVDLAKGIEK